MIGLRPAPRRKREGLARKARVIGILAGCLLSSLLFAQEQTGFPYYIRWDPVAGAGGYVVEVEKATGAAVKSLTFAAAARETELNLPAGDYRFRIVTLNNLKRRDSETEWIAFTVEAYAAPVIQSVQGSAAQTGDRARFTADIRGLAVGAKAWLDSPSGKRLNLSISKKSGETFALSGDVLAERGTWSFTVQNPPNLTATYARGIRVEYPEPRVRSVSPESWETDAPPDTLRVRGSRFSPELTVSLVREPSDETLPANAATSPVSAIPLVPVATPGVDAAEFLVPEGLAPGSWRILVANASDLDAITGPLLVVNAPPPEPEPLPEPVTVAETLPITEAPVEAVTPAESPPQPLEPTPAEPEEPNPEPTEESPPKPRKPRETHAWLSVRGGPDIDLAWGTWSEVYGPMTYGGSLGIDWAFSAAPVPQSGAKFSFTLGLRGEYGYRENDGLSVYVKSDVHRVTGLFTPGVSLAWRHFRARAWGGAGMADSELTAKTPLGETITARSLDFAYGGGVSAEWLPIRYVSLGLSARFSRSTGINPLDEAAASAFVGFDVPLKW